MRIGGRGRSWRFIGLGLAGVVALAGLLTLAVTPVTTRQGVDYVVTSRELPVYLKALDFVDRDVNYRTLTGTIVAGTTTDEARAVGVFEWTRANIRNVPAGFPVVDDHVWSIIVRGYGAPDQKADVFTTLASYAGVPAYWLFLGEKGRSLPLSFARIAGRWRVFDVHHGLIYRSPRGELATVEEVAADLALVRAIAGGRLHLGRPYVAYFVGFGVPRPPDVLRSEMQMTGRRLWNEGRRFLGRGGQPWDPWAMMTGGRR